MIPLCILAAGRGSRVSSWLHKSLLPIDNRAVLSHIIEKTPPGTEVVIAVGYQGHLVRDYCLAAHPEWKFTFVNVENYSGPGSGPGHSLSCCRSHLQRPFYLFCSDCIVGEELPPLDCDWIGVHRVSDPTPWSTADVQGGVVRRFVNKSPGGFSDAFVGVAGIKSHDVFWGQLRRGSDGEFEMVSAFYEPQAYPQLKAIPFTWHDTGTTENYLQSQRGLSQQQPLGMKKEVTEATYLCGGRGIKLFGEASACGNRVRRAGLLVNLVPPLAYSGEHVYAYPWVQGRTLYEANDPDVFARFLGWCKERLWEGVDCQDFSDTCRNFYYEKTQSRVIAYLNKKGLTEDGAGRVNGRPCLPVQECLARLNWERLFNGVPVRFHGDLQPENILVEDDGKFVLIDWRDSFGGLDHGDLYYDLGKMAAGLHTSFDSLKKGNLVCEKFGDDLRLGVAKTDELRQMEKDYYAWLDVQGFEAEKVRDLIPLIYLNMAPLHVPPVDDLLFHQAKYLFSSRF